MSKTVYYVAATADGFIADENGELGWLLAFDGAEGVREHYENFLKNVGAIAMGAATYEWLLAHEGPKKWAYPGLPTWVFTNRAESIGRFEGERTDVRFVRAGDGAATKRAHEEMVRAAQGKDVWMVGGGKTAALFSEQGLLDEMWLTVAPVVLGRGAALLPTRVRGNMELVRTKTFGMGLIELVYRLPKGG